MVRLKNQTQEKQILKQKLNEGIKEITKNPEVIKKIENLPPKKKKSFLKRLAVNFAMGAAVTLGVVVTAGTFYHLVGRKMVDDTVDRSLKKVDAVVNRNLKTITENERLKDLQSQLKEFKEQVQALNEKVSADQIRKILQDVSTVSAKVNELDIAKIQDQIVALNEKLSPEQINVLLANISTVSAKISEVDIAKIQQQAQAFNEKVSPQQIKKLLQDVSKVSEKVNQLDIAKLQADIEAISKIIGEHDKENLLKLLETAKSTLSGLQGAFNSPGNAIANVASSTLASASSSVMGYFTGTTKANAKQDPKNTGIDPTNIVEGERLNKGKRTSVPFSETAHSTLSRSSSGGSRSQSGGASAKQEEIQNLEQKRIDILQYLQTNTLYNTDDNKKRLKALEERLKELKQYGFGKSRYKTKVPNLKKLKMDLKKIKKIKK